jgi:hypothetical protein
MTTDSTIEERLTAVEKAVADLQQRLAEGHPSANWLDHLVGSVRDEELFREAMRLGREYRESDRPADDADDQP